ncbi:MAG TPA: hypothetical protein VFX59_18760 [Polyangiales bacterium]|nr:hypothetical protein [Polyangiales bacterium]
MKRTWLIGAALVLSLTAVGCSDDDEGGDDSTPADGGRDSGTIDASTIDSGLDSGVTTDAGDAGPDAR